MRRIFNLHSVPVDTSRVVDVASGTVGPFTGMLPQNSYYGDIALLRRGRRLDVFVSGLSVSFPFVMRIRIEDGKFAAAVLAASRASGIPNVSSPRGVAVSPQGLVMTTLPTLLPGEQRIMDRLFAFAADFPEGQRPPPAPVSREQVNSRGMTSDTAGNFYVASGSIGAALCGVGGSGAIVKISADLKSASCINFNTALSDSEDVAVSPRGDFIYVTMRNLGMVVRTEATGAIR
jgi:hypothetical protein